MKLLHFPWHPPTNNHHDWYLVRLDRFSDSLALGLGNLTGTREEKQTKYLCPPAPLMSTITFTNDAVVRANSTLHNTSGSLII